MTETHRVAQALREIICNPPHDDATIRVFFHQNINNMSMESGWILQALSAIWRR